MAQLGQTADLRLLVPGDPEGVRATQAAMARLGAAMLRAGDGLRRVDTAEWTGEAADAFRSVFHGVPAQWSGSGEAFLAAADALADHGAVLEWAQQEAAGAADDWARAQAVTAGARNDHARAVDAEDARAAASGTAPAIVPFVDPGETGRAGAHDRLERARAELRASGDDAARAVGQARDLAPPSPSLAARVGSVLGDAVAGMWHEVTETGDFLWQIDPTRFLVEPAAAAQGWGDLAAGAGQAATHPVVAAEAGLNVADLRTNPARWAGETSVGLAATLVGGGGAVERVRDVAKGGRIAAALEGSAHLSVPNRFLGKTAAEHVLDRGRTIGRASSGRKSWVREVDDPAQVKQMFDDLSHGGQVIDDPTFGGKRVVLPDETTLNYRLESGSTSKPVTEIRIPGRKSLKIHLPRSN